VPGPAVHDGFGDVAFQIKYRLLSANEEHGNYILTAFLGWSVPTGSYTNGSLHAIITPTIAYGKGFGHFDGRSRLDVNREQVVLDRRSGMSLTQVAKKHCISRASVCRLMKVRSAEYFFYTKAMRSRPLIRAAMKIFHSFITVGRCPNIGTPYGRASRPGTSDIDHADKCS
jgi:Putative MetA-pathway of phenol degradation